uniref:RNase H type-1 domain-containing protein n=1 Tax=Fagus sylvatica TaxID=28930 RepID=A0A2N9I746_FAGSY
MGVTTDESAIIFTTEDFPPEGRDHNRTLYVTIDCMVSKVLKVLVDNGSSINVCPMHTVVKIRLTKGQLTPSSLTVQPYNESSRGVIGTFEVECRLGPGWESSTKESRSSLEVYSQDAKCKYGLGYKEEMGEMPKNKHTLNGNFVKPGEDFPYYGFPEPKGGNLGFEIFFKTQLTLEDKALVEYEAPVEDKAEEDWVEQMDPEAMKMFIQEGDVFHIAAVIVPSDGITSILSFEKKILDIFRDLNKACSMDDFPLPHIDVLVDNTAGSALMSFMDGFSRYNQILMALEDMTKTTFVTEWGIYYYTIMPFGLKNVGTTYQRMATALLHEMMHKEVEVYVDDMIVKSVTRGEHIANLRKGIEVDPITIKAILEMPSPNTEKEIRGFLGRLQYIDRFIARLTTTCEPIFKLLKKGEPKEWTEDCEKAFEAVKEYFSNPPVLEPPKPGRPLNLYLSVIEDALGSMLAQEDEDKQEHAIYYMSKRLKDYETQYTAVEKSCYDLVWPALIGKLSRWLILLAEFDLTYVAKNTIKGRVIAEHCAGHPIGEDDLDDDFPDKDVLNVEEKTTWKMYFDEASNQHGYGVGVLLIAPDEVHIPLSAKLNFVATNNVAEYEACIVGLEALLAIDVKEVEIYGDSALVLAQAQRIWKTKEEHLKPYQAYLEKVCQKFTKIEYTYVW